MRARLLLLVLLVLLALSSFFVATYRQTYEQIFTKQTPENVAREDGEVKTPEALRVETVEAQSEEVYRLLDETNYERVSRGLGALALKQSLINSAMTKCLDMQTRNYWAHSINDEVFWKDFTDKGLLGENLAQGSLQMQAVRSWMNSPGHRKNILEPGFSMVGFATCDGPQRHLVVQHLWGE